jgi:hypothetical protein
MDGESEISRDVTEGLAYIRSHTEISNVLLTGGDPLLMSTHRLKDIVRQLRQIDHVGIIRIGSKMPAFNPFRITDDANLLRMISTYSTGSKRNIPRWVRPPRKRNSSTDRYLQSPVCSLIQAETLFFAGSTC